MCSLQDFSPPLFCDLRWPRRYSVLKSFPNIWCELGLRLSGLASHGCLRGAIQNDSHGQRTQILKGWGRLVDSHVGNRIFREFSTVPQPWWSLKLMNVQYRPQNHCHANQPTLSGRSEISRLDDLQDPSNGETIAPSSKVCSVAHLVFQKQSLTGLETEGRPKQGRTCYRALRRAKEINCNTFAGGNYNQF